MERQPFEKTQEFLAQLVRYLESLSTGMRWDPPSGSSSETDLPDRIVQILVDCGYLEGLNLKAQGILSGELQDFITGIGMAFEVQVALPGTFKLPFVDSEADIQRKTLNAFMEKAWILYHGALLSAYAMKPLRFERIAASSDGMEVTMRVREVPPEAGQPGGPAISPETAHYLNNALMGITSYVSLILSERKDDKELQNKLGLVLEAAQRACEPRMRDNPK